MLKIINAIFLKLNSQLIIIAGSEDSSDIDYVFL
jgi:hypothetical protein